MFHTNVFSISVREQGFDVNFWLVGQTISRENRHRELIFQGVVSWKK